MDILIGFLMVLEGIVCALLILIVLMQRPRQEGLGAAFGGGMTDQMFGAQTTNVLQKGTTWLGIALFILTFTVAVLMAHGDGSKNLQPLVDEADLTTPPAATAPATPGAETPAPAPAAVPEASKEAATPAPAEAPKTGTAPAAAAPMPAEAPKTEEPIKQGGPASVPGDAPKKEDKPEGAVVPPAEAPAPSTPTPAETPAPAPAN